MSTPKIIGNAFIGIALPEHITNLIANLCCADLRHIKYVKPSNLHITLKFLGILEEQKIVNIKETINQMQFSNFYITLSKATLWKPNLIVIETELNAQLKKIKHEIDKILFQHALIPFEDRPFKPHITIARAKSKHIKAELDDCLNTYAPMNNKEFRVKEIHLYQSIRIEGKQSDYVKLSTIQGR